MGDGVDGDGSLAVPKHVDRDDSNDGSCPVEDLVTAVLEVDLLERNILFLWYRYFRCCAEWIVVFDAADVECDDGEPGAATKSMEKLTRTLLVKEFALVFHSLIVSFYYLNSLYQLLWGSLASVSNLSTN